MFQSTEFRSSNVVHAFNGVISVWRPGGIAGHGDLRKVIPFVVIEGTKAQAGKTIDEAQRDYVSIRSKERFGTT